MQWLGQCRSSLCEGLRHPLVQGSIVQALESDFSKVQELVEEAVRQLSSRPGASSVAPMDACGIMEVMNESHVTQLLPRCTEGDAVLERFRQHCLNCKVSRAQCTLLVDICRSYGI